MKIVSKSFFEQKTLKVARELLGKYLVRRYYSPSRKRYVVAKEKIIETEAYVGPHDLACQSSHGKTNRNQIMYREAGTIYVYFTYGMHWMLNIVTEEKDFPSAVLIRGLETVSGPGRLTKTLKIDKSLNGQKLGKKSGLWIESDLKIENSKLEITRTPRIGIAYAGSWALKPYRFVLKS